MSKKIFTFTHYMNRVWSVGELKCDDGREWRINKFWEVDKDWFYIFEACSGSGIEYTPGTLLHKIYIGDSEYCELKE